MVEDDMGVCEGAPQRKFMLEPSDTYLSRKPASPIVNSAIGCAAWHKHAFSTMNALTTFH
jgi:hypothetical protein